MVDDDERERPTKPIVAPASISELVAGYAWSLNLVGEAGAVVHRLHAPDRATLYLKHGTGDHATQVTGEMVRQDWLAKHVSVPRTIQFVADADAAWLLMTAMPGRTAWQWLIEKPEARQSVVAAIVAFLQQLHAIPIDRCPFDSGHAVRLAAARDRMEAGEVDEDDFGEAHAGWSARQVWDRMMTLVPAAPELVVTHGDFSLDNILIADGRVTGVIDCGRVGVADRYQDLAILWDCLGEFDAALQTAMMRCYGIEVPDEARMAFHLCLDEFF